MATRTWLHDFDIEGRRTITTVQDKEGRMLTLAPAVDLKTGCYKYEIRDDGSVVFTGYTEKGAIEPIVVRGVP